MSLYALIGVLDRDVAPRRRVSPWIILLAAYATANMLLGLTLAFTQPARADDVWIVYDWCRQWLWNGQRLYAGLEARTDYPPNAIVVLSPLAMLPRAWVVPLWTSLTLAVTPFYAFLVAKLMSPRARGIAVAIPILLFMCWGGTRTFLEFSRLSIVLAAGAAVLADAQPTAAGALLGLALVKPHIAGPFALWALATRRLHVLFVAAAIVIAGWALYCLHARADPAVVTAQYARILWSLFAGPDAMLGLTSLQPWWLAIGPAGVVVWLVVAMLLLAIPFTLAMAANLPSERSHAVLALFCLWSLLTLYNISSNVVVLVLPAFVWLLCVDRVGSKLPVAVVGLLQAAMMLDIPVHLRPFVGDVGLLATLVSSVDRVAVLVAFAAIIAFTVRPPMRKIA